MSAAGLRAGRRRSPVPAFDRGAELRCYLRDPDRYLIQIGQSTGLLHGEHAAKGPEDLPG